MATAVSAILADISRIRAQEEEIATSGRGDVDTQLDELARQEDAKLAELEAAAFADQAASTPTPGTDAAAAYERPAKRARSGAEGPDLAAELLSQFMASGGLPDSILSEPGPGAVVNAPLELLLPSWRLLQEGQLLAVEDVPTSRAPAKGAFVLTAAMAQKIEASLLAGEIRRELAGPTGDGVGIKLPLARLLRARVLQNEAVQYVRRDVPLGHVLRVLEGTLTGNGGMLCGCEECNGEQEVPPSVFEEHSGSLAKKPAENITLTGYGVSLKDIQSLVTSDQVDPASEKCLLCGGGRDLLQCPNCDTTFHPACLEWPEGPEAPCPACMMQGAVDNVALRLQEQGEEDEEEVEEQEQQQGEGQQLVPGATLGGHRQQAAAGQKGNGDRADDSATESDTEMQDAGQAQQAPVPEVQRVAPPRRPAARALPLQLRAKRTK